MADSDEKGYVTTRELAAQLSSMRWEMRALILIAALANLGLGYSIHLPGVTQAVDAGVAITRSVA